jgi:hypothetical protein
MQTATTIPAPIPLLQPHGAQQEGRNTAARHDQRQPFVGCFSRCAARRTGCHCDVDRIDYAGCSPADTFPCKERILMSPDILIIQDQAGFHLLHGYLHLAMALNDSGRAAIDVPEFGTVLVARTPGGLMVETEGRHVPLLSN